MTKKDLLRQIEQLTAQLNEKQAFTNDTIKQYSQQLIELKSQLDANEAQMKIGTRNEVESELDIVQKESMYNEIMSNSIPTELTWLYWIWINQKTAYWLNHYTQFETEKYDKDEIINAIWIAIMYGKSFYNKKNNLSYSLCKIENNKVYGYPASKILNNQNYMNKSNGKWTISDDLGQVEEFPREDVAICTWRFGNVGNFVWYLIYGCLYLYVMTMVPNNASMLLNVLFMEVNDLENFKTECREILNPMKNIKPILKDRVNRGKGTNILGESNSIIETNFNKATNIEQLIMSCKFINETLCNEFGIMITSAKNQSLSSDANLSASTSELIAEEHHRRIKDFLKQLDIELEIYEPDVIEPQNENADKEGNGMAKTDGDEVEKKGKN